MKSRSTSPSFEEKQPLLNEETFAGRIPSHHEVPEQDRVYFEVDPNEVDMDSGSLLSPGALENLALIARILEENDGCETHRVAVQILHDKPEHRAGEEKEKEEESDTDTEEDQAPEQPPHIHRPKSKWRFVMYTFPVADALFDATQTCIGLSQGSWGFNAPVSLINFFSTFGLNAKFGVTGTEDLVFVIKNIRHPKIPPQWNEREDHSIDERLAGLSRGHEISAFVIASLMTGLAAIADSVQCYFFLEELPKELGFENSPYFYKTPWKVFGSVVAALEALSVITGEGIASWKETRNLMAGVRREYRTMAGKYIGRGLGVPLGLGDSVRDGLLSYIGIMYIFDFENIPAKVFVGIWGGITGVCNYSTNGPNIIDHFDRFFGSFVADDEGIVQAKDAKNIISFLLSGVAGGLFGYAQHKMIEEEVSKLTASLNLEVPLAVTVLAYWCYASITVNSTGNLFDLMYLLVNTSQHGAEWLYNKIGCGSCCTSKEDKDFFDDSLLGDYAEIIDLDDLEDFMVVVDSPDNHNAATRNAEQNRSLRSTSQPGLRAPVADNSRLFRSHSLPDIDKDKRKEAFEQRFTL